MKQNSNKDSTFMKKIGTITPEERDEIQKLHGRKLALKELFLSLPTMNNQETQKLYDALIEDMGSTSLRYEQWWSDKSKLYDWENIDNYHWEINFDTCEIFLKK